MSKSADPQRLARAHKLSAELRTLQERMNRTIEDLCELVSNREFFAAMPGDVDLSGDLAEATLSPSFLQAPSPDAFLRNPPTGQALGPDAAFYSDYAKGVLHIVQQPLQRHADSRYSLIINFAEFDGDWFSVVLDMRALLSGMPAGRARVGMVVETTGAAQASMSAKCVWAGAKWREEAPMEIRLNQLCASTIDIDFLDPAQTQTLDLHLVFNPVARGSIEIRRVTASLSIQPLKDDARMPASVFENAP